MGTVLQFKPKAALPAQQAQARAVAAAAKANPALAFQWVTKPNAAGGFHLRITGSL